MFLERLRNMCVEAPAVTEFLRQYRIRCRTLHAKGERRSIMPPATEVAAILSTRADIDIHGEVLIFMLYFGTTLVADEIRQLGVMGVQETSVGEIVIEPPSPDPVPHQIWLDDDTIPIMKAFLNRLPPDRDRLFQTSDAFEYDRSQIYQLVAGFRDDEEDAQLRHFFPIYHETDYAVVPTPLRLNADTHYTGRGVTIAFIDSGFYPHPDLIQPRNRVRAYLNIADGSTDDFAILDESSWHGMQTSVSAAGNGYLSKGLYKAIAPEAEICLLRVRGRRGIQTRYIIEALEWCVRHQKEHNIRIINISLSGDRPGSYLRSALDQAAEAAVQAGIVVVVAAGNAGGDLGSESICPPASAPSVITVGGLNDNNRLDVNAYEMYWSSYGPTVDGILKPEIVAPGIWIAAPILPGTAIHREAIWVDRLNRADDDQLLPLYREAVDDQVGWPSPKQSYTMMDVRRHLQRVQMLHKLVPPHYQHVDGTSFSAPIVCSVIAQMLEANPKLTPARVKKILTTTTDKLYNVPIHRQGNGLIHPRKAVKEAANDLYRTGSKRPNSPHVDGKTVTFYYRSARPKSVAVAGEFNSWSATQAPMTFSRPDLWSYTLHLEHAESFGYKYVVDGTEWVVDPENLNREPDGFGGLNGRVNVLV